MRAGFCQRVRGCGRDVGCAQGQPASEGKHHISGGGGGPEPHPHELHHLVHARQLCPVPGQDQQGGGRSDTQRYPRTDGCCVVHCCPPLPPTLLTPFHASPCLSLSVRVCGPFFCFAVASQAGTCGTLTATPSCLHARYGMRGIWHAGQVLYTSCSVVPCNVVQFPTAWCIVVFWCRDV